MVAQAFFFNAIFFTSAQVLEKYYGIPASKGSWYLFVFRVGQRLRPRSSSAACSTPWAANR